jgi:hypothetical protein
MTVTHIKEGKVRNLSADYGFQETLHYVMYISTCQPLAMQTMQLVVRRLLSRAPLHQEILQLFIMQISFLSRTIDFFFFFLSLWIYLWLAETSQQPISQTTWLKVIPHYNHCNHYSCSLCGRRQEYTSDVSCLLCRAFLRLFTLFSAIKKKKYVMCDLSIYFVFVLLSSSMLYFRVAYAHYVTKCIEFAGLFQFPIIGCKITECQAP